MQDLDQQLDELYGLLLGDFTRRRNELVKQAKAEGDQEAADELAQLRKPSIVVWTINQLARRKRRELDFLLDAGHRLREGHRSVLAGKGREALGSAESQQEQALETLLEEAKQLLASERGAATETTLDRIRATLRAAAVNDEARELLARGRLEAEVEPTGFDALVSLVDLGEGTRPAGRKRERSAENQRDRLAAARKAVDSARAAEREASKRSREAERAAAAAKRDWEQAETEAEKARADLESTAEERSEAEERLRELRRSD